MTGWTYLGVAILFEILATTALKISDGLARWQWAALSILLYGICFLAFAPALKTIPVGIAYAIWSGVGIIAMAILGAMFFDQKLSMIQMSCILLVLVGAIGLRVSTP
jgi:multidrug transporter EmrE-like cation transporter